MRLGGVSGRAGAWSCCGLVPRPGESRCPICWGRGIGIPLWGALFRPAGVGVVSGVGVPCRRRLRLLPQSRLLPAPAGLHVAVSCSSELGSLCLPWVLLCLRRLRRRASCAPRSAFDKNRRSGRFAPHVCGLHRPCGRMRWVFCI